MSSTTRKVIVIGMDGLDPARIRQMVARGQLPHFARLAEQGTLSDLATSNPAESPVAWTSLATGCNPGKHGIFDFIHRHPRGRVPYLSLTRESGRARSPWSGNRFATAPRVPGFWRFTADAGIPTTVIRWPVTFPAERVTGRFLSGLGTPDVLGRPGRHTVFTTAKDACDGDKTVVVQWHRGRIDTALPGPLVPGLRGQRPMRARIRIERRDTGITLEIAGQRHLVRPGQWSEWFRVTFKWGPLPLVRGIVKFYLTRIEPELHLLATPVQIDPTDQVWPLTQPAEYGRELFENIGHFYTLGLPEDTDAVTGGHVDLDGFLHQCAEIDAERTRMLELELGRFSDGLLAFVIDASDRIQHMFWSITDPESPTYDPALALRYAHVVPELYRDMDRYLGYVLSAAGQDTAVFVVSDHGFSSFHRAVHVNRWLIENGYMALSGTDEGGSLLADVDWDHTSAYAVGFTSIYLNRQGREPGGIVPAGAADSLRDEIAGRLRNLVDPRTGRPVVRDVYRADRLYSGPAAGDGPDLVIGFEPGCRASWQTALGGAPQGIVEDNTKRWAADHLVDPSAVPGVLASNLKLAVTRPTGMDLAPTILAYLSLPVPAHMDGRSWLTADRDHEDPQTAEPLQELDARSDPDRANLVDADTGLTEEERRSLENRLSDLGYI